jgi:outer membrane protein assembly factor BamB
LRKLVFIVFFVTLSASQVISAKTASNPGNQKATYRYDLKRSGYIDINILPPLELQWFFNTNSTKDYVYDPKVSCGIVGEGDILYFGTLENVFCAFDTSKKEYKWRYNTYGIVSAGATLTKDKIIFGDTKGYLYCLKKETGKILWQQNFKDEIISSPLVVENKVFFNDMSDTLYCISKDTGEFIWKFKLENYLKNIVIRDISSPSYNDGFLYQGFSDGYLYCFNTNSSKEIFKKKIKDEGIFYDVDSPAAIDGDTVYSSSFDGSFLALKSDQPTAKWNIKVNGNGYPAFSKYNLIISTSDGNLYSVDKTFGNIIWERKLSSYLTAPVITDDYIFVSSPRYLYVVDIKNGKVEYEFEPGSGISSELCLINDSVYFISNKGYIYCFKSK